MITLEPIINRLERMGRDATNLARTILDLTHSVEQVDNDELQHQFELFQDQFVNLFRKWILVNQQIEILKAKGSELSEYDVARLPEQANDNTLIMKQLGNVLNMRYVVWAETTTAMPEELLEPAVQEAASYPGGKERLLLFKQKIEELGL